MSSPKKRSRRKLSKHGGRADKQARDAHRAKRFSKMTLKWVRVVAAKELLGGFTKKELRKRK